jgi:hypothetical protein
VTARYAVSTCKYADTLGFVGHEPLRGKTVSAPDWWRSEARARYQAVIDPETKKPITQEQLAELVQARYAKRLQDGDLELAQHGPLGEFDQSRVSRCLKGEITPLGVMIVISDVLRLPPPVFVTRSLQEAREMHSVSQSYASAPTSIRDSDSGDALADADGKLHALVEEVSGADTGRQVRVVQHTREAVVRRRR